MRILMSASMNPTFWCSMTGTHRPRPVGHRVRPLGPGHRLGRRRKYRIRRKRPPGHGHAAESRREPALPQRGKRDHPHPPGHRTRPKPPTRLPPAMRPKSQTTLAIPCGEIAFLFGKELQHIVFRQELAGDPVLDRGWRVHEADTLITGSQALRYEIHHDIVEGITAAIIEGTNVVAWPEAQVRAARKRRQGSSHQRNRCLGRTPGSGSRQRHCTFATVGNPRA